ncbi:MAG: DUF401 family protein [Sulfolobales archaeon]
MIGTLINPLYATIIAIIILFTLLYRRVSLATSLLTASLALAVLTLNPQQIPIAYYQTAIRPINIDVILASAIIAVMANIYRESGIITRLSNAIMTVLKKTWIAITIIPAIFGFLPVPGGALMSAPLVSEISNKTSIHQDKAAYINVWFRHLIAPIYPLTQIVILTSALSGFDVIQIALYDIPLALVMYLVGFLPIYRDLRDKSVKIASESLGSLSFIIPLIISVFIVVSGINVVISTLVGLLVLIFMVRPKASAIKKSLFSKDVGMVIVTSYAALSVREVLVLSKFPEVFVSLFSNSSSLFLVISIILVSAVLGFMLGIPTGALAVTVPLIASVAPDVRFVSLTLVITYLGYMVSPSHLCLVLTLKYFKTHLGNIYRYLIPSTLITLALTMSLYLFIFLIT